MNLGKGIGTIAVDRPALLCGEDAWSHADKLLFGQVHQRGEHDVEGKARGTKQLSRAIQADEAIVAHLARNPGAGPLHLRLCLEDLTDYGAAPPELPLAKQIR